MYTCTIIHQDELEMITGMCTRKAIRIDAGIYLHTYLHILRFIMHSMTVKFNSIPDQNCQRGQTSPPF